MQSTLLVRLGAFAAALALATPLVAQDFPTRPIRLVIPGPPGGGTDVLGRMLGDGLAKVLGQPVVADNKPGASGMVGANIVAKAPADGYTLFMAFSATLTSNQWLYKSITYDPIKDFVPVAAFAQVPNVLLVHPSVPAHSVADLIALAKAKPGQLNFASSNPGSLSHLSMEMLKLQSGASMVHIPYNGDSPSMSALVAGQVEAMVTNTVNALPMIRAGRVRPIGVTSTVRASVLPDVPTIAESGLPGFDAVLWYGLVAPAGTPRPIVERLNAAVRQVLGTPDVKERLATSGSEPMPISTTAFASLIQRDADSLGRVIRAANIKLD